MFQTSASGTSVSTSSAGRSPTPNPSDKPVRHLVYGTPHGVQTTIYTLYQRGYAEPGEWSKPIPTGPGEVMVVLTKRLRPGTSPT